MERVSVDRSVLRLVLALMRRAADRSNNPSLADAAAELEADAKPLPRAVSIPEKRIAELCGDGIDDLRPGQAYRQGWNDCVEAFRSEK